MFGENSPAVLVVGAGPVGLFAALCLARQGARVDIIGEAEDNQDGASRAPSDDIVVLSPSSLALLDQARVTSELLESSRQVASLELYDREQLVAQISFARWAADLGSAFPFVAVASRIQLQAMLRTALERHHVKVRSGWRLALMEQGAARTRVLLERLGRESTGYATLHTELVVEKTEELEPRFVIAAECRAVPIYRQLGIELTDLGKRSLYAVFDGKRATRAPDNAVLIQGEQIDAAFWPRSDDWLRCLVDIGVFAGEEWFPSATEPSHAGARDLVALSSLEGRLTALLAERAPSLAMRMSGLEPRALFSTQPRLASEFGRGRIWLAGAAAHSAAPLAGQTSNGGLHEAARLAELCARALTRGDPSDALDDSHREAARDWPLLLAPAQPARNGTRHALLGRLSAGLAASCVERDALFAQL